MTANSELRDGDDDGDGVDGMNVHTKHRDCVGWLYGEYQANV